MKTTPDKSETPATGTGEKIGAIESEETKQETIVMEAHAPVGVSQRSVLSTNQLRPTAAATLPLAPVMPETTANQFAHGVVPIMPEVEAISNSVSPFVARRRRNRNGPNI